MYFRSSVQLVNKEIHLHIKTSDVWNIRNGHKTKQNTYVKESFERLLRLGSRENAEHRTMAGVRRWCPANKQTTEERRK